MIPRHRGGMHTWDNLVTACKHCNHRKGDRLLIFGAALVLMMLLRPGGLFLLCYEPPTAAKATELAETLAPVLAEHGFAVAASTTS